jgi:hypothetical protein
MFETPVKQSDGSYVVPLASNMLLGQFKWERTKIVGDLKLQPTVQGTRENVLRSLVSNKELFRQAPSLDSLRAITPVWGMLIRPDNTVEWNKQDIFNSAQTNDLKGKQATISLSLKGVQISRQSILPIWDLAVIKVIPEEGLIDLDFGGGAGTTVASNKVSRVLEDAVSVDSEELEGAIDDAKIHLKDPGERKRQHKEAARALLRKAAQAQLEADSAVERFYAEFDLSEDESEVSDLDESGSDDEN